MKIFAYGSNMYSKRLYKRVKSAKYIDKGFVNKHKIAFHKKSKDGSSKADCFYTGKTKDKTWGVIFEINPADRAELDKYEGLGEGYDLKTVNVHCENRTLRADAYITNNNYIVSDLLPYDWYVNTVITGAKEYCLPQYYIDDLKKIKTVVDENEERSNMNSTTLVSNNDNLDMGGFKLNDWKILRASLNKKLDNFDEDWEKAIEWFKKRLNKRYLDPLNEIPPNYQGEGFTIASIICILLEHLAAIRNGKIHNYLKQGNQPTYEYKNSSSFYIDFLKTAAIFEGTFYTTDGSLPPFCADDFYKNVRCALLHEACTKNDWKINISQGRDKLIVKENHIKSILRDNFLKKISEYINDYTVKLKNDRVLRLNFARKMDSLCEILPDPQNYEWWQDN